MMYSYPHPRPALTVDVVTFTLRGERLQVLLVRRAGEPFAGDWALPERNFRRNLRTICTHVG